MFSTLLGPLPSAGPGEVADQIAGNVADLEAAGLELLSNGLAAPRPESDPASVVHRWEVAAAATERPVKQSILGPHSASRRRPGERQPSLNEAARGARAILDAVVAAGCPFVEIVEPELTAESLGSSAARRRFGDAHRRLLDGLSGIHVSLVLAHNLDTAGPETFFDLPYASYAFDLIAGPDNWRLITAAPTDRGIVCGALDPRPDGDESRELLVWAAQYAASTSRRGMARVGLTNAWSFEDTTREIALRKLARIADGARVASIESADELASLLDPRAIAGRFHRPRPPRPAAAEEA